MIEYCAKCGEPILDEWIKLRDGTLVRNVVLGNGNDKFCSYCAKTCFFINGKMYKMGELIQQKN